MAYKHGFNKARTEGVSRFYRIWIEMRSRCNNKNRAHYPLYGGRGIKCQWETFESFKNDMYPSYLKHVEQFGEKNTSIDRIDNSGHYTKSNCRWATQKEQCRNKRRNVMVTYDGQTKSVAEWADVLGLRYLTLYGRLFYYNWPVERAFTEPKNQYFRTKSPTSLSTP